MRKSIFRRSIPLLAAGFALAACSSERLVFQDPPKDAPEAKIGFVQYHNVYSWNADTDTVLHVEAMDRTWYRVELFAPCIGIEYADRVAFLPSDPAGDFDRFSYVAYGHQRCKVSSVKRVPPPAKVAKGAPGAAPGVQAPVAKPGTS